MVCHSIERRSSQADFITPPQLDPAVEVAVCYALSRPRQLADRSADIASEAVRNEQRQSGCQQHSADQYDQHPLARLIRLQDAKVERVAFRRHRLVESHVQRIKDRCCGSECRQGGLATAARCLTSCETYR